MNRPIKGTRDNFENWLIFMEEGLRQFYAHLPIELAEQLDFTPESLPVLEAWLLAKYPSAQAALDPGHANIMDGIARYIGETFRQNLGGQWDIELGNPNQPFAGVPVITGFDGEISPVCPLAVAAVVPNERTGVVLSSLMQAHLGRRRLQ